MIMKKSLMCLPVLFFLFIACDKQDTNELKEPSILNITIAATAVAKQSEEISVTIEKPTPCYKITDVETTSSGSTVNYNFIVTGPTGETMCADVIQEEVVTVIFEPERGGEYTLNFLLNGTLAETRTIIVSQ